MDEQEHEEKMDPIHCHHADVVARIHALDRELHIIRLRHEQAKVEIAELKNWITADEKRSQWYYSAEPEVRQIVESKRWLLITRHVVAWTVGSLLSLAAFWHSVMPFLRGEGPK